MHSIAVCNPVSLPPPSFQCVLSSHQAGDEPNDEPVAGPSSSTMHMHICKQADMHRILSTTDRHTKKSSHMSRRQRRRHRRHPSFTPSFVIIIFAINDIATCSHPVSSLCVCITQLHRVCIASLPGSTGIVCSSTSECYLELDRLVVCVPQVQGSSNGRHNGIRPSIAARATYMGLSHTR